MLPDAVARRGKPRVVRSGTPPQAYSGIPGWVRALAALAAAVVVLPLLAMVLRVDWAQFIPLVTSESSLTALGLSLRTSAASTVLCIVLGVPLALVLARDTFRLQGLLRSLVLLPLVLPPVVGGIALLYTFGRQGLLGRTLDVLGVHIAFSTTAVVLAQTFVALPFLVVSLEGALRSSGSRYEAVAATLGARPGTVFRRVTLPLVLPGLASGAVLSFARSLGEFGATLTFAGSLQGVTRTLPLEIYLQRETDPDAAVALSLVLVAVAVAVVALAYRRPAAVRSGPRQRPTAPAPPGGNGQ
ncbi:MAG: ABC transporter permease [Actinomycetes bacterium]